MPVRLHPQHRFINTMSFFMVRINKAGCLERCEEGPALVIYPEGVWYTYVDTEDIDEIIDVHIVGGKIVERLKI
jgi:(2Fe-2S) ferredoxin